VTLRATGTDYGAPLDAGRSGARYVRCPDRIRHRAPRPRQRQSGRRQESLPDHRERDGQRASVRLVLSTVRAINQADKGLYGGCVQQNCSIDQLVWVTITIVRAPPGKTISCLPGGISVPPDYKAKRAGQYYSVDVPDNVNFGCGRMPDSLTRLRNLAPPTMQPYLNKFPERLVGILPELANAAAEFSARPRSIHDDLGASYRTAQPSPVPGGRQPFTVDPVFVERGLRGHADTQNALAQALREAGLDPRSPGPAGPNFDLAWENDGVVFVAEVKSITDNNEEEQLRLGLGQVLRYRQELASLGYEQVTAVLVPERSPRDTTWRDLCTELGVVLVSGEEVEAAPRLGSSVRAGRPGLNSTLSP
jgi:hypothetical protein